MNVEQHLLISTLLLIRGEHTFHTQHRYDKLSGFIDLRSVLCVEVIRDSIVLGPISVLTRYAKTDSFARSASRKFKTGRLLGEGRPNGTPRRALDKTAPFCYKTTHVRVHRYTGQVRRYLRRSVRANCVSRGSAKRNGRKYADALRRGANDALGFPLHACARTINIFVCLANWIIIVRKAPRTA